VVEQTYVAVLISAGLCALVVAIMVGASRLLGQRTPSRAKQSVFEAGNRSIGDVKSHRFPIKFYLTAILFIVFDVEVVFMYPWAVVFRRLGWFGLAEMAAFVLVLGVGLAYVWKVGALEWE
jgi:NADH-quinone oxidoreductase subunit A